MGRLIKRFKERLLNFMRKKIYLQFVIIFAPILVSLLLPSQELLYAILGGNWLEIDSLKSFMNFITQNEKIASIILGSFLSIILLIILRKSNKEKLINSGNDYFHMSYYYFFIASKVLGFGKVTLIRVPIQLQYKLVINDTFNETIVDTNVTEKIEDVKVLYLNIDNPSNEINFILSDTYITKLNEIPQSKLDLPTVIIERAAEFNGIRTINPKFIEEVRKQTNVYRNHYDQINIFATTNTNHNKAIFEQCFKNGNRTGFKKVVVYEQKSISTEEGRTFYFDTPFLFE